jgi:Uma2 family endonuclease
MDTRRQTTTVLEPPNVPLDRLYRMAPEVYHGMIEHGLIADRDRLALVDGLLVREAGAGGDNGNADPLDRLYRMPLDVYHEVGRLGLIHEDEPVELLDGLLVNKMTRGAPHVVAAVLIMEALRAVVPAGWHVRKEDPIALPTGPKGHASEPEPDVSVVRGTIRDYAARHPSAADMALVIEVAESSLRDDRAKLARYAWENIAVAWIVNLNEKVIEVSSKPSGPVAPSGYGDLAVFGADDHVPVVIDGREVGRVAVRDLLP